MSRYIRNASLICVVVFSISCTGNVHNNMNKNDQKTKEEVISSAIKEVEESKKEFERKIKSKVDIIVSEDLVNSHELDRKIYFSTYYDSINKKGEYETNNDYVTRLNSKYMHVVDANKVFYFEIKTKLSRYMADEQQYMLYIPGLELLPTAYHETSRENYMNFKPSASKSYDAAGQYFVVPINSKSSVVTDNSLASFMTHRVWNYKYTKYIIDALAAYHNRLSSMVSYRYNFYYSDTKPSHGKKDANYVLKIPLTDAKRLSLQNDDIIARVGIKYAYGVGPIATGTSVDSVGDTFFNYNYLAVDLDSVCLLRRSDREILSCKLRGFIP